MILVMEIGGTPDQRRAWEDWAKRVKTGSAKSGGSMNGLRCVAMFERKDASIIMQSALHQLEEKHVHA